MNDTINLLKLAIKQKSPISFRYTLPGKNPGHRVGNPHALFFKDSFRRDEEIKVDLYQTSGVSDSEDRNGSNLPGWRLFRVDYMEDIKILDLPTSFSIAPGYNSNSDRYLYSIEKI